MYDHYDQNPYAHMKRDCECKHRKIQPCQKVSAFKAVKDLFQFILGSTPNQVIYPVEVFDSNNEYNPDTSTFVPKSNGIYTFTASIFLPIYTGTPYSAFVGIRVNGEIVAGNQETITSPNAIVATSSHLETRRGDEVQVVASSPSGATIEIEVNPIATRFEGAKIG